MMIAGSASEESAESSACLGDDVSCLVGSLDLFCSYVPTTTVPSPTPMHCESQDGPRTSLCRASSFVAGRLMDDRLVVKGADHDGKTAGYCG